MNNTLTKQEKDWYEKLNPIDSKCGALLQLDSILLVFTSMPSIFDNVSLKYSWILKSIIVCLIFSVVLLLFVLFFKEHPTKKFVNWRKFTLNFAVVITGICSIVVGLLIIMFL